MAQGSLDPAVAAALGDARTAIERGEYGRSLRLLEPLAERYPPAGPIGAGVRLLMTTALMGMGENERATACCRSLQICVDPTLRTRARDLQQILEAPALRRPRQWSLTLPDLSGGTALEGTGAAPLRRRRQEPPPAPPPPVGETRAPLGFAALTLLLLTFLLLASLLGGCLQVRSELHFEGPGRLQLSHELRSPGGRSSPWQARVQQALNQAGLPFRSEELPEGRRLSTPVLPASEALAALGESLRAAAALADVELPPPQLHLQETNWLIGVRQQLRLDLDLTALDPLPALDLQLRLSPLQLRAIQLAEPQAAHRLDAGRRRRPGTVVWPLQAGMRNQLQLSCWRWSPLGVGGVLIAAGLALVLLLQRIRLQLGFGPPQLPA